MIPFNQTIDSQRSNITDRSGHNVRSSDNNHPQRLPITFVPTTDSVVPFNIAVLTEAQNTTYLNAVYTTPSGTTLSFADSNIPVVPNIMTTATTDVQSTLQPYPYMSPSPWQAAPPMSHNGMTQPAATNWPTPSVYEVTSPTPQQNAQIDATTLPVVLPETLSLLISDSTQPLVVRLGSQTSQAADGSELQGADWLRFASAFTVGIRGLAQQDSVVLSGGTVFQRITYKMACDASADVANKYDFMITLLTDDNNRVLSCLVVDVAVGGYTQARFIGQHEDPRQHESQAGASTRASGWPGPSGFASDDAVVEKFIADCKQDYFVTAKGQKARKKKNERIGQPHCAWIDVVKDFTTWIANRQFNADMDGKDVPFVGMRTSAFLGKDVWDGVADNYKDERPPMERETMTRALNHLYKLMQHGKLVTNSGIPGHIRPEIHPSHTTSLERYRKARNIPSTRRSNQQYSQMKQAAALLKKICAQEGDHNGKPIPLQGIDGQVYSRMDPHDLYRVDPQAFNNVADANRDASDYADWIRNGGQ